MLSQPSPPGLTLVQLADGRLAYVQCAEVVPSNGVEVGPIGGIHVQSLAPVQGVPAVPTAVVGVKSDVELSSVTPLAGKDEVTNQKQPRATPVRNDFGLWIVIIALCSVLLCLVLASFVLAILTFIGSFIFYGSPGISQTLKTLALVVFILEFLFACWPCLCGCCAYFCGTVFAAGGAGCVQMCGGCVQLCAGCAYATAGVPGLVIFGVGFVIVSGPVLVLVILLAQAGLHVGGDGQFLFRVGIARTVVFGLIAVILCLLFCVGMIHVGQLRDEEGQPEDEREEEGGE